MPVKENAGGIEVKSRGAGPDDSRGRRDSFPGEQGQEG